MSGRGPGRRAVLRWAVRLFRREWRQQLLVLVLLTVAVAAAVVGSTSAINAASDSTGQFGAGHALVRIDGTDAVAARAALEQARLQFGTVDVIATSTVTVPGSIQPLEVRDQDPRGPYSAPMLARRAGRYPSAAGEVALTTDAAERYGATIGSTVTLDGEPATVVGIVENPSDLRDQFALVAPGTLSSPAAYRILIELDGAGHAQPVDQPGQAHFGIEGADSEKPAVATLVLVASTLAMVLVGLVAAAGFVVVAQRRQRQLGLLAAIGATERDVRLVMVGNGVIVGIVAAVAGTALGIAGWLLAAPAVESAANHRIDRFDVPWVLVAAMAVLAIVVATLAAWWPARAAARLPVMAALSGRPARPRPVHRSLLVALVLVAAGVAGITFAQPRSQHVQPLLLIGGLLGVVIGAVLAAPAAIRLLGPIATRLPFAPRLALRDLARYQARAAAALAAITLGLAIAVTVVGVAAASEPDAAEGNLSNRELLVLVGDPRTAPDPDLTPAQLAQLDQRAAAVVAAMGDGATGVPLDVAFSPDAATGPGSRPEPVALGRQDSPHSLEFLGYPYLATPELLALYGIDAATIDDATALLTARDQPLRLLGGNGNLVGGASEPPKLGGPLSSAQHVDLPSYQSAPSTLITEAERQRNGWVPARAGWIVESAHALSAAQIKAARAAAASTGLAIEVRSHQDGPAALRTGATLVGALLAMAIVAMAVGLIRGESARDIRTLTATGATARTRRALTASTAAALALLGVVLGMAGAYIALVAVYRGDLGRLVPVPVTNLVPLALGLPLAASIGGWLLAGREPSTFARQALD